MLETVHIFHYLAAAIAGIYSYHTGYCRSVEPLIEWRNSDSMGQDSYIKKRLSVYTFPRLQPLARAMGRVEPEVTLFN